MPTFSTRRRFGSVATWRAPRPAFLTFEFGFTIDAYISVAGQGQFTADAVIFKTQTASFTADAVIFRSSSATFTADAIIRRTTSATFTIDAFIPGSGNTVVSAFTIDAIKRRTTSASFTANALISRTRDGNSFTIRAFIVDNDIIPDPAGCARVRIRVDGVEITNDVVYSDAFFTSLVNGTPGSFRVRVKDVEHTRSFTAGQEIWLDINGVRRFGGYITHINRVYAFPVDDTTNPDSVARFFVLTGVDYNILFRKRVVRDKDDPTNMTLRSWPADTEDHEVVRYVFDNYTDLPLDGFTHDGVEHVGTPNPDRVGVVGSGGLYFGDLMREINRLISAVYYFDPYRDLKWVDVDTPNATKGLSDHPTAEDQVGYRDFEYGEDGADLVNDAFVWGAGAGSDRIAFSRETNAASITAHGLWQYGEFTSQLYKPASVAKRADSIVLGSPQSKRGRKDPKESWALRTFDQSFVVGQKVAIESEVFGISDVVPIRRMTITFPTTDCDPMFDMILSHEIDEPWNLFEFPPFPGFNFDPSVDIFGDDKLPPDEDVEDCDPGTYLSTFWEDDGSFSGPSVVHENGLLETDGNATRFVLPTTATDFYTLIRGGAFSISFDWFCGPPLGTPPNNTFFSFAFPVTGSPSGSPALVQLVVSDTTANWRVINLFDEDTGYEAVGGVVHRSTLLVSSTGVVFINDGETLGTITRGITLSTIGAITVQLGPADFGYGWVFCSEVKREDNTTGNWCFMRPSTPSSGSVYEGWSSDDGLVFSGLNAYLAGSTQVFVAGLFKRPGIDYTESDPAAGEITFSAPPEGNVTVYYFADGRIE